MRGLIFQEQDPPVFNVMAFLPPLTLRVFILMGISFPHALENLDAFCVYWLPPKGVRITNFYIGRDSRYLN